MASVQQIKKLIPNLPEKDAVLALKFLDKRDFESILELVESDLYKLRKTYKEEEPNEQEISLVELKGELITYMSYLEVPDNSDEYEFY